jgi:hypothetical protein
VLLGMLILPSHMSPHELAVIFLGRLDDALLRKTPGAEGRHEGVVLAPSPETPLRADATTPWRGG